MARPAGPPATRVGGTTAGASDRPARSTSTPSGTATKAQRPAAATPNGDPFTATLAVRTPFSTAEGAVAGAQAGGGSDRAESGRWAGETVPATGALTRVLAADADARPGAKVYPVQVITKATAHAAEMPPFARYSRMPG